MLAVLLILAAFSSSLPKPTDTAWAILQQAAADNSADKRAKAVQALGLITRNKKAEEILQKALLDANAHVRVAAAKSIGEMGAVSSRANLIKALNDTNIEVVIAAANALYALKDPAAYDVYYALLTGERKSSEGLLQSELNILKDRKSLEKLAFETGLGFVPFGGMGYEAWKTVTRDDSSPVRAAAAERLATDPDPKSGRALANSCGDGKWTVRAAAVEAIVKRGDPALLYAVVPLLDDSNDAVRYDAAAAVIQLNTKREPRHSSRRRRRATRPSPSQPHPVPSAAPK